MKSFLKEFGSNNSPSVNKTRSKTARAAENSIEVVQGLYKNIK